MKNFNYKQSRKIIIQKTFLKKRIFKSCEIPEKNNIKQHKVRKKCFGKK